MRGCALRPVLLQSFDSRIHSITCHYRVVDHPCSTLCLVVLVLAANCSINHHCFWLLRVLFVLMCALSQLLFSLCDRNLFLS